MNSPNRPEPAWITRLMIQTMHADQLRQHGGVAELRKEDRIQPALDAVQARWGEASEADLAILAAAYAASIVQMQPFVDGNVRVAFMAMYTMLGLNGYRLEAPEPEAVVTLRAVATGAMDEDALSVWIRGHTTETSG